MLSIRRSSFPALLLFLCIAVVSADWAGYWDTNNQFVFVWQGPGKAPDSHPPAPPRPANMPSSVPPAVLVPSSANLPPIPPIPSTKPQSSGGNSAQTTAQTTGQAMAQAASTNTGASQLLQQWSSAPAPPNEAVYYVR